MLPNYAGFYAFLRRVSIDNLHFFLPRYLTNVLHKSRLIKIRALVILLIFLLTLSEAMDTHILAATPITFTGQELLGRPTDTSITIKIVPDQTIQYYYEFGTSPGSYIAQTTTQTATGGQPHQVTLDSLSPNTKYYYRMQYNYAGTGWVARSEHSFWTQREQGEEFTFTITSDSHVNILLGNASTWTQTMTNVAADQPDFHLDLGDTFAIYTAVSPGEVDEAEAAYEYQLQFFNLVSHSAPIYLAMGNHEQSEGWHRAETSNVADSLPALTVNAMKKYFLNPAPDTFYDGNSETFSYIDGNNLLEDYFAWQWGDALFVFIDPFWYTTSKAYTGAGGGGEVTTGSGDRWDWTLGQTQFNWLKQTLENSHAPYKFIFAHHMVGGSDDYVRGGANPAHLNEWGGYNEDNQSLWEFDTRRAGWGPDPVHQILVNNKVSAFFHGHDHQYGYEKRDGVVYQSMPAAGFSGNGFNLYITGNGYTIQGLPSPGHLRVTVNAINTTVEYVATTGAGVNHTYTIAPTIATDDYLFYLPLITKGD